MAIRYGRGKFVAHENYIAYMNAIADSPIYSDMPNLRSSDGRINWQVSSGKTTSFYRYYLARAEWWTTQADKLGLPGTGNSNDRFSIAARIIHPTKLRACRLCGENIYVGYMYLNAVFAKRLTQLTNGRLIFVKMGQVDSAFMDLENILGKEKTQDVIKKNFPERSEYYNLLTSEGISAFFIKTQHFRSTLLSPGFMANPPDRLDGFHDYCLHCRKNNDPGRSDENMSTYNHDRRAFMWWAEGDWKVADEIYNQAGNGTCTNCGKKCSHISPDHVGPLACGFKQNGFFEPLCSRCNSSKNRRFTFDNVISLIEYEEKTQDSVACWQVRSLWDKTKNLINDDAEAKVLSNIMRIMQDFYLRILHALFSREYCCFLLSILHPEFAYFDIEIINLDTSLFSYDSVRKIESKTVGTRSLAARSIRIAFDELNEYCSKPQGRRKINRKYYESINADIMNILTIFKGISLEQEDLSLYSILSDYSMTLDERDAAIQKILESTDLNQLRKKYSSVFKDVRNIFTKRGEMLALEFARELSK